MDRLNVFTAFSGYDSQCMALDRLGVDYELVGWSEIDKFAIQAHNAIYPQWADRNLGDISKVNWGGQNIRIDLFTYSFPCTDISNAGAQKGLSEGSGTRSSLLWECKKVIEAKKPKYLLMENVKAFVSKKFRKDFMDWERYLSRMGYSNFYKVLNSKDYGVPQNRERVFMVSILDDKSWYHFPAEQKLEKFVRDLIEESVEAKYYCGETKLKYLFRNGKPADVRTAILTSKRTEEGKRMRKAYESHQIKASRHDFQQLVPRIDGICNTITTVPKDNLLMEDFTLYVRQATSDGFKAIVPGAVYDASYPNSDTRRGRVQRGGTIAPALTANGEPLSYYEGVSDGEYKIRYLTPRETLRFMDVDEGKIDLMIQAGLSDNQLYKMAGNSIVVAVLSEIFRKLFVDTENESNSLF